MFIATYSDKGFGPDRRPEPGSTLAEFVVHEVDDEIAERVHADDPDPVEVGFGDVTIPAGIVTRDSDGNPIGGVTVHREG